MEHLHKLKEDKAYRNFWLTRLRPAGPRTRRQASTARRGSRPKKKIIQTLSKQEET